MKRTAAIVCAACLLWGCATSTANLKRISLGMDKEQIEQNLGEPTAVRGAIRNIHGQTIEVWEYRLAIPKDRGKITSLMVATVLTVGLGAIAFADSEKKDYWLYFYDEKLAKWGQAGDWAVEEDRIYMIDFSAAPSLTR